LSFPQCLSLAAAIDVDVVGESQAFLQVRSWSSPTTPPELVGAPVAAYDLTGNRLRVSARIQVHPDDLVGRQKGAVRAKACRNGQAGAYQDGRRNYKPSLAHITRTRRMGKSSAYAAGLTLPEGLICFVKAVSSSNFKTAARYPWR
jgi:hypothetical protein